MRERVASRAQKKRTYYHTGLGHYSQCQCVCVCVCVFPVTEGYWTGPTCQIITTGQRLLHRFWSGRADLAFADYSVVLGSLEAPPSFLVIQTQSIKKESHSSFVFFFFFCFPLK